MNLHRQILEGSVPIPVQMTLGEIVRDGKITNPYQTFVLSWVADFFKNGIKIGADLEMPVTAGSGATHTEVIDSINALSPEDQVALAAYLLATIKASDDESARIESSYMHSVANLSYTYR